MIGMATRPRRRGAASVALGVAMSTARVGCGFSGANTIPVPGAPGTGDGSYRISAIVPTAAGLVTNAPIMLQDDPDVKIFNAQTEMKEFSEREGKIYARLGRQVYETDGGENYPEIRAELDLLAANKQAAESRPRTCRGRGTCPPGSRGAGA